MEDCDKSCSNVKACMYPCTHAHTHIKCVGRGGMKVGGGRDEGEKGEG